MRQIFDTYYYNNKDTIDRLEREYLENEKRKDIELRKELDEIRKNTSKGK